MNTPIATVSDNLEFIACLHWELINGKRIFTCANKFVLLSWITSPAIK